MVTKGHRPTLSVISFEDINKVAIETTTPNKDYEIVG